MVFLGKWWWGIVYPDPGDEPPGIIICGVTPDGQQLRGYSESHYLYDNDGSLLVIFNQDDSVKQVYVNGIGGQEAVYADNRDYDLYYFLKDHLGSTRVIIDDNGRCKQYINYYPFGENIEQWVSYYDPLTYTGKERDQHASFDYYYFGARYYDPELGMFSSIDKAGQTAGGFLYAGNNPISMNDPDGNWFLVGFVLSSFIYSATTDNFQFEKMLGYGLAGGLAAVAGAWAGQYSAMAQSAVNSSVNSLAGNLIDNTPIGVNFGAFSWSDGNGWSIANPFKGNLLESTSAMTGWMATGKDVFKATYYLGTSEDERAQEAALQNRLDKEGEYGTRQKYLKLESNESGKIDHIKLDESSTNNNNFAHSGLKGRSPDNKIYRSMKAHYKFVNGRVVDGFVDKFTYAEVHFNRIAANGLGRSWFSGRIASTLLHVAVDGESSLGIFKPIEGFRNDLVNYYENAYQIRSAYVY